MRRKFVITHGDVTIDAIVTLDQDGLILYVEPLKPLVVLSGESFTITETRRFPPHFPPESGMSDRDAYDNGIIG
jgi:hypothetical protein